MFVRGATGDSTSVPRPDAGWWKPRFSTTMPSYQYTESCWGFKTVQRSFCLVYPVVRDKCRLSEIDWSQPRHGTALLWRHKGPVTSQLTDLIGWPIYRRSLLWRRFLPIRYRYRSATSRCKVWILIICHPNEMYYTGTTTSYNVNVRYAIPPNKQLYM